MENKNERVFKDERFGKSRFLMYHYEQGKEFTHEAEYRNQYNQAMAQQAWDLFQERIEQAKTLVQQGKASPILYFMEKALLNPRDLSMHVGLPLFRVKRHLKSNVFSRLSDAILARYASAFDITPYELKHFNP